MSDKQPMQAAGGNGKKGQPDGVGVAEQGRTGGGQSGGGAFKDKSLVPPKDEQSGFFGHGGQREIDYHGDGDGADDSHSPNDPTGT